MATATRQRENLCNTQTFIAGTGGTTRGCVAHLSAGTVINANADADENIGIFCEAVDAGSPVRVALPGCVVKGLAYDDAISAGDFLIANGTAGRVDTQGATTSATYIVGQALDGSDAAGQLIPMTVNVYTRIKAT